MKGPVPIDLLTEAEWSGQVADLARMLQWKRYHTYNSQKSHTGYPDETLVRDRIIFLELKTESGRLTADQREWLGAILDAAGEAYVARPRDLEVLAGVLGPADRGAACRAELAAQTRAELGRPP